MSETMGNAGKRLRIAGLVGAMYSLGAWLNPISGQPVMPSRRAMSGKPWWKNGSRSKRHSGPPYNRAQEEARRARQVERLQLNADNGLTP